MVMYAGNQVELGSVEDIFYESRHPYTLGLLASLPRIDEGNRDLRLHRIEGQPPSLINVPPGCPFHPRCPHARLPEPCARDKPALRPVDGVDHLAACHYAEELRDLSPTKLKEASS
jgi:oligopeptide/dipeptide ABC transporter ATP-binding protein